MLVGLWQLVLGCSGMQDLWVSMWTWMISLSRMHTALHFSLEAPGAGEGGSYASRIQKSMEESVWFLGALAESPFFMVGILPWVCASPEWAAVLPHSSLICVSCCFLNESQRVLLDNPVEEVLFTDCMFSQWQQHTLAASSQHLDTSPELLF